MKERYCDSAVWFVDAKPEVNPKNELSVAILKCDNVHFQQAGPFKNNNILAYVFEWFVNHICEGILRQMSVLLFRRIHWMGEKLVSEQYIILC